MGKQLISWQVLGGNVVGHSRNVLFKLFDFGALILEQDVLGNEEVEEFLFNFGVH